MPALPPILAGPLSRGAELFRETVGGITWKPALAVAKPAVLSVLSKIEKGTLLVVDEPGETRHVFGQKLSGKLGQVRAEDDIVRQATIVPRVEIVVKNDAFWVRLFLFGDMGFAEAYMLNDFECEDLTSFFQVG